MNDGTHAQIGKSDGWIVCGAVVFLTTLSLCGRIVELYLPYGDIALLTVITLCLFWRRPNVDRPVVYGMLLTAILVAGLRSSETDLAFKWVLKLAALFAFASSLVHRPQLCAAIFNGARIAVLLNGAAILLALVGFTDLIIPSGEGRAFTVLTYSGVLARIGASCLFYYIYVVLGASRISLADVAGLLACTAIMMQDGSRTSMILAIPVPVFAVLCLVADRRTQRLWVLALVLIIPMYEFRDMLVTIESGNPLYRVQQTIEKLCAGDFEDADGARYQLAEHAMQLIRSAPVLGSGLGAARLGSDHQSGYQVVHNAYLQLWAESGLLGLIATICLMWCWTGRALQAYQCIRTIGDMRSRAFHYNMLFMLLYSGLSCMSQPFGTECSDWIIWLGSYAAIYSLPLRKQLLPSPSSGYGIREH